MRIITGRLPEREPLYARYLATVCVTRPDLMEQVDRIIDEPPEWSQPSPSYREADWLRVADNKRVAMHWFEDQVAPSGVHFDSDTYDWASVLLSCRRIREEGSLAFRTGPLPLDVSRVSATRLEELARLLYWWSDFADDLETAGHRWARLLAGRPRTAPEEEAERQVVTGQARPFGHALLGIDGARYTLATCHDHDGTRHAGALVTHHGGGSEILRFASMPDARGWLGSRTDESGPLVIATGPACRVAREEQLLAWLMDNVPDPAVAPVVKQVTWTSHLRRLIYDRFPRHWPHVRTRWFSLDDYRSLYRERLLWTPREYSGMVGWPDCGRALAYWDRLRATPVSTGQAMRAAWELAAEDMAAARAAEAARAIAPVPVQGRDPLPGGRRRAIPARQPGVRGQGQPLLPRPRLPDLRLGPEPRA